MKSFSYDNKSYRRPVRVLHVYPHLICGGVERVMEDIIRHLDSGRFSFDILTQEEGDNEEVFENLGVRILRLPYSGDDRGYRAGVRKVLQEGKYDAVHCHSHREMSSVNMEAAALKIPVRIAHSHNAHQDITGIRRWLRGLKFHRHSRGATDLLACSQAARDWMFPFGGSRRKVIPNGISIGRFRFNAKAREEIRRKYNIPDSVKIILNIGRASLQKNQSHIVNLAKADRNSDRLYVIIGDGPLLDSLKKGAWESGMTNILFLGERHDVEKWLSAADVFLFPSIFEGQGLAPMEAQAAGLEVIAGEGTPEEACIRPGHFHRIEGWDISTWLQKVQDCCDRAGRHNREVTIPEEFDSACVAAKFSDLYSPAKLIFCNPVKPAWITGGDRYNLQFAQAASKALGGRVRMLSITQATESKVCKLLLPWRTLRTITKIVNDYRRKGLKAPAWLFNTSKCLYLLPGLLYLKTRGATTLGITHHPLYIQMKGWKRKIYKLAELYFIKNLTLRIIPSAFTGRILSGEIKELTQEFIPIPFDLPKTPGNSRENEEEKAKKSSDYNIISKKTCKFAKDCAGLLFIGTIEPRKGLTYLFEAMRLLHDEGLKVNLKVAGKEVDQNYSGSLRTMASEWHLDVSWEGYVSEETKQKLLSEADIFVLPSEAEGFGIVLVEAMLTGTPVVAFRNSGVVDVIGPAEERGLLAADRDPKALAAAIRTMIEDEELRAQKVSNAMQWTSHLSSAEDFERAVEHLCGNTLQ